MAEAVFDNNPFVHHPYFMGVLSAADTDEEVQKYLTTPAAAPDLEVELGFSGPESPVEGMVPISNDLMFIQHLPYYSPDVVDQHAPHARHLTVPGRVAQITYETDHQQGEQDGDEVTVFAADLNRTNGSIWLDTEVANKANTPIGRSEVSIQHAYAIFVFDPEVNNDAHDIDPMFKGDQPMQDGDWRLVEVLTDADRCPHTGYVCQLPGKGANADDPPAMLTDLAPDLLNDRLKSFTENYDRNVIMANVSALITASHRTHHVMEPYAIEGDIHLNPVQKRFIRVFEQSCAAAPEFLAVPLRAYNSLAVLNRVYEVGKVPKEEYERRRDIIFNEVLEAWAMVTMRSEGNRLAELSQVWRSSRPDQSSIAALDASPVRWTAQIRDPMAKLFEENVLANLRYEGTLTAAAKAYTGEVRALPEDSVLSIMPTANNSLLYSTEMWGTLDQTGPFSHRPGQAMKYAGEGTYYPQAVASLYTPNKRLQVPGVAARVQADMQDLANSDRVLVVDLMTASSVLLRKIIENGHLDGITPGKMPTPYPTLSSMMLEPRPAELVVGMFEKGEGDSAGRKVKILGNAAAGAVVHFIGRTRNLGEKIVVDKVRTQVEVLPVQPKPPRYKWQKPKPKVERSGPIFDLEREVLIGSLAVGMGGLQMQANPSPGTVMEVMRSIGPVSKK